MDDKEYLLLEVVKALFEIDDSLKEDSGLGMIPIRRRKIQDLVKRIKNEETEQVIRNR